MFTTNLLPGQGFKIFTVCRTTAGVSRAGRPKKAKPEETNENFYGILVRASQKEIEQWKQSGHPITHTIVEHSAQVKAKATEYLTTEDGRQFYIQGVKNPGDLNVTMIYYVEERFDLKKSIDEL